MTPLFLILGAYVIGAIPTGYWLGLAWKGIDVRKQGSGNLGATNVFRVLGVIPGLLTLAIDIAKGAAPIFLARHFFAASMRLTVAMGIAAIVGHTISIFVHFRGGKGVATSAGVFAALLPWPTAIAVAVFLICLAVSRYVSVSSITAAIVLAGSSFVLHSAPALSVMATGVAGWVTWKHRMNLQRLREGTESRLTWSRA